MDIKKRFEKGYFLGGYHVKGVPNMERIGFVARIIDVFRIDKHIILDYTNLNNVTERLPSIQAETDTSLILFQLGNYEFEGSLKRVLKIAFNIKLPKFCGASSDELLVHSSVNENNDLATKWLSNINTLKNNILYFLYSIGYLFSFLLCGRYAKSFRMLNAFTAQHPKCCFVFITPFPTLSALDSKMRKLGGYIMQRKIKKQENVLWIDSHEVIPTEAKYFIDDVHLTNNAHELLANWIITHVTVHLMN